MSSVHEPLRRLALAGACLFLTAAAAAGCSDTTKGTYRIEIKGPAADIMSADVVSLLIADKEVARASPMGKAFNLGASDFDPATTTRAVFAIRAFAADNSLRAFGQTPPLEILTGSATITIFVQRPGTLALSRPMTRAIRDQMAITATTLMSAQDQLQVTLPVFGFGKERRVEGASFATERGSNELLAYNPYTHLAESLTFLGQALRSDAAAVAHPGGSVFVFGGLSRSEDERLSGQLDVFSVARSGLTTFGATSSTSFSLAQAARRKTVMAAADQVVVAVGGLGEGDVPLDNIVLLNPGGTDPVALHPMPMTAPRLGHTATTVVVRGKPAMVLIYGGAPAGGSVADLFAPVPPAAFVPFAAPPQMAAPVEGTGRKDHVAIEVTVGQSLDKQVLIFGGLGDDGAPRADSIIYDPATTSFRAGPLRLKTPRSRFVAFTIDKDLVVVGGRGADGKPLASAEVYDLGTFALVSELPAVARWGASAGTMSNVSVAIVGGENAEGSTNAVEIYQPRR